MSFGVALGAGSKQIVGGVTDIDGINMGIEGDNMFSAPYSSEDIPHRVDNDLIKSTPFHFVLDAMDHLLLAGAGRFDCNQVTQELCDCRCVQLCCLEDPVIHGICLSQ